MLVIPQDLRGKINQREIRFSLQTEQRQKAVLLASHLIAKLSDHISELRRMTEQSVTPTTGS